MQLFVPNVYILFQSIYHRSIAFKFPAKSMNAVCDTLKSINCVSSDHVSFLLKERAYLVTKSVLEHHEILGSTVLSDDHMKWQELFTAKAYNDIFIVSLISPHDKALESAFIIPLQIDPSDSWVIQMDRGLRVFEKVIEKKDTNQVRMESHVIDMV